MRRKHSQATAPPSGNYAPKAQKASERAHTGITALDPLVAKNGSREVKNTNVHFLIIKLAYVP